jgi:23S rRNA (uracil747-C5)-methyltransferase
MNCHHYTKKHCLSCDLLSLGYVASVKHKEQVLSTLFQQHHAKIKPSTLSNQHAGSRNKAKLAVALINNEIQFGFYDSAQQFKVLEDCPLHAQPINQLLLDLKHILNIKPYNLKTQSGELKLVLITYSESTNQMLLRFVLRSRAALDTLKSLVTVITQKQPSVTVITANIQSKHQAILEGDEEIVLTPKESIAHQFGDVTLYQGPRSFFQTHSVMAFNLYQHFQNELSKLPAHSLLDLYCGVGAFSFFAAKHCKNVTGVEISEAATAYANQAKAINAKNNIEFIAMDVEVYLKSLKPNRFDAILVNPPRRGLNQAIIDDILRLAPNTLFYSSCNAETLHRDWLQLESQYEIASLQLFDMFPHTSHFETLMVLTKKLS